MTDVASASPPTTADETEQGTPAATTPVAAASAPPRLHPLQSTWSFWYCEDIRPKVKENPALSYDVISHRETKMIDQFATVEEMWSLMNALPQLEKCGVMETFMLYRGDIKPFWEEAAFADGDVLTFNVEGQIASADSFLAGVVMVVLGEVLTVDCLNGRPDVCGGIRWCNRGRSSVRFEIWTTDTSSRQPIVNAVEKIAQELNIRLGTLVSSVAAKLTGTDSKKPR